MLRFNFVYSRIYRQAYPRPGRIDFRASPPQAWERPFHAPGTKFTQQLQLNRAHPKSEKESILEFRSEKVLRRLERAYMRDERAHLRHE